jgi:wyosine [tRNA(Phe)-imidazoG37] synthetase (radical SAM superfamily)
MGKTQKMITYRCIFHDPDTLVEEIKAKLITAQSNNESIDYLTIVSDGEPTLDAKLGLLIDRLRPLGIKIAVFTNSTLLNRPDVRHDLCKADWVSVKIDTLDEKTWRKIARPHNSIKLDVMLDGICSFAKKFTGRLVTETMLIKGLNDDSQHIEKTADFIRDIDCATAYLSIPTRPPAEKWVRPPGEQALNQAYHLFEARGINTNLIGYEGNPVAFTGDIEIEVGAKKESPNQHDFYQS